MARLARPLGALFLVINLTLAALWLTVLHPGSPPSSSQAAGSVIGPSAGFPVGLMLLPDTPGCALRSATSPVHAPDSRPVAQLATIPSGLSQAVAVGFTPCSVPSSSPPAQPAISVDILSEVRYTGSDGTLFVTAARPSAGAMSQGLYLGDSGRSLHDGSAVSTLTGSDAASPNQVRWLRDGLIITVAGSFPLDQLSNLADSVTVVH